MLDRLEQRVLLSGGLTVPVFNSKLGAKATLFLDFDGDTTADWGNSTVYHPGTTPAFDSDNDPTTFSNSELSVISEVCARVAEKYSPFDLNLTTVDPGSYLNGKAARVVIGGTGTSWAGGTYGGLSFVSGFTNGDPNTGWIFSTNLSNVPKWIAEATSHEAGHLFGLQHQSIYDASGSKLAEYAPGDSAHTPVMGNSYNAVRGLWWYGHPATSSVAYQDDVAVISNVSNGFGYRADEAGGTIATAGSLSVNGNSYSASGVITTVSDVDLYRFTVPSTGSVTLNLNVAQFGAMLDGKLQLEDSTGQVLVTADTDSLSETMTLSLTAGTYYVAAESHGATGDIGQYTISGSFSTATIAPPSDPANLLATVVSPTAVHLIWTDQSNNEAGFRLESSTDGTNWSAMGTVGANVTSFDDTHALPGTTYTYRVRAYIDSLNSGYAISPAVTTWGGGSGLHADYFDNSDFTGNMVSQTDATVNFNWQSGSPTNGISPGTYSVRWTGQVQALETGTYQFSTTADDGVRLWVNGQMLVDRWSDVNLNGDANGDGVVDRTDLAIMYQHMGQAGGLAQGDFNGDGVVNFIDFQIVETNFGNPVSPVTNSGSIALQAGVKYDIKLEYYELSGAASVKLVWETPSSVTQVIPQGELFLPPAPPMPGALPSASVVPYGEVGEGSDLTKKKIAPVKVSKAIFSVTPVVQVQVKVKVKALPRLVVKR